MANSPQILADHQAKGLEDQALEADVARKTKAAKARAARRGGGGAARAARSESATADRDDDEATPQPPGRRTVAAKTRPKPGTYS